MKNLNITHVAYSRTAAVVPLRVRQKGFCTESRKAYHADNLLRYVCVTCLLKRRRRARLRSLLPGPLRPDINCVACVGRQRGETARRTGMTSAKGGWGGDESVVQDRTPLSRVNALLTVLV